MTIVQIICVVLVLISIPLLNHLKGTKTGLVAESLGKFRTIAVYLDSGLLAATLAFAFGLVWVDIGLAFLGGSVGYAIFRQFGPTLGWLGGQLHWSKHYVELPNNEYINKLFLRPLHGLDIRDIPMYGKDRLRRIGNIGGAYRGFLYLLPMAVVM